MSDYLDPNNEELLKDFFMEAQSQVDALEQNLLVLENEPTNRDAVDEIFRAAHTLKGGAATVQMMELSEFTHIVEDVFDGIRNKEVAVDGDLIDTLLASIDIIKAMLDSRSEGEVYGEDISEIKENLRSYLTEENRQAAKPAKSSSSAQSSRSAAASKSSAAKKTDDSVASDYELAEMRELAGEGQNIFRVAVYFDEDNPMNTVGGIQVFAALKEMGSILKTVPEFDELYEDKYHPTVEYFVATETSAEELREKADIPDVVSEIELDLLDSEEEESAQVSESAGGAAAASAPKDVGSVTDDSVREIEDEGSEIPASAKEAAEGLDQAEKEEPKQPEIKKSSTKGSVLRVDSTRIDNLLNLVSEAVITKATFNQLNNLFSESLLDFQNTENIFREKQRELFEKLPEYLQRINDGVSIKEIKKEIYDSFGDIFSHFDSFENGLKTTVAHFRGTAQNLGRITTELHEKVLQIRMVPISQIFSRFPRLVRDLSKSLEKQVKLIIEGEDTELDKSVIDDLLDPLIHCVRNSIDHGIEQPEERRKAGKPPEGRVLLRASNEGNMIIIEISDDGKGISVDGVRQKAVERGVIHPNKELSDVEAFNLIFEPGFSTAKEVTNISGRGVGLDATRSAQLPRAVRTRTGMSRPFARHRRSTDRPSIPGRPRSRTTRS